MYSLIVVSPYFSVVPMRSRCGYAITNSHGRPLTRSMRKLKYPFFVPPDQIKSDQPLNLPNLLYLRIPNSVVASLTLSYLMLLQPCCDIHK